MVTPKHSWKSVLLMPILVIIGVSSSSTPTPTTSDSTSMSMSTYITGFSVISSKDTWIDADHRHNAPEGTSLNLQLFGSFSADSSVSVSSKDDCSGDSARSKINILEGSENRVGEATVKLPKAPDRHTLVYICLNGAVQGMSVDKTGKVSAKPWLSIRLQRASLPKWLLGIFVAFLLTLSALFSGLNLGLLSLDKTDLKVIINTGSQKERSEALKIVPVRNHGNYLLCSLLFSNVLVNTILTVVVDSLLDGGWDTVVATTLAIVIFGEILPQAICCRYGLTVGAKTILITKLFMFITFPIAYPVGKVLDMMLGEDVGAVYTRDRLKELLKVTRDQHGLESEEMGIISGTLDMKRKTVKDVMIPTDSMYMIPIDAPLSRKSLTEIEDKGFSRIPIYQGERWNVVGLVNVRQLVSVDPEKTPTVKEMLEQIKPPHLFCVFENTRLDYMLKAFREGSRGHMAFVQKINDEGPGDPKYETVGLVTLEDVLEELLQAEIYDENDVERLQLFEKQGIQLTSSMHQFSQPSRKPNLGEENHSK